ncbi:uncharacterized protein CPUR_01118 [Claviceps purpurea 20.1]|uniref:Uncharacterized protein n=2 Tax=Claviceps TaxID=5110 RepID=M1WAD5_CLAP2|nr:uncharacterized protein CPUR_01118 [Claviceps purpurea 20.1]
MKVLKIVRVGDVCVAFINRTTPQTQSIYIPFAKMNTIKSVWYGWGVLCLAGGGAYYFAKQEINAERQAKVEAYNKKQRAIREGTYGLETKLPSTSAHDNKGGSPGADAAGHDPAASSPGAVTSDRSPYEAEVPLKPRRGNRLS